MTVELLDLPGTQICHHFPNMFDFIKLGITNGAVLVHWYDSFQQVFKHILMQDFFL